MTAKSKTGKRREKRSKLKGRCKNPGCLNGPTQGDKFCDLHKNIKTEKVCKRESLSCEEKRRKQDFRRRLGRGQELRAPVG